MKREERVGVCWSNWVTDFLHTLNRLIPSASKSTNRPFTYFYVDPQHTRQQFSIPSRYVQSRYFRELYNHSTLFGVSVLR